MKTPDETKKDLEVWGVGVLIDDGYGNFMPPGIWQGNVAEVCRSALTYIQQLESTYSQVSKALCRKENATFEELLQAVDQLKSRLAQAERERDALMHDLKTAIYRGRSFNLDCEFCKDKAKPVCENCSWEWRGVCEENTKED